jgi:hypothetical protein
MKRLLVVLVAVASLGVCAQASIYAQHDVVLHALSAGTVTAVSANAVHAHGEQTDPATITVFVTRTGAKYHRDGCRYLSKSKIPMTLKDAAARYTPCSVCKPPTLK